MGETVAEATSGGVILQEAVGMNLDIVLGDLDPTVPETKNLPMDSPGMT